MYNPSTKKYTNYGDPHSGQSLFQFLKRKKKFTLKQVLTQSQYHQSFQHTPRPIKQPLTASRQPLEEKRQEINLTLTPKKVKFVEIDDKKVTNKSFIDMISPLSRKNTPNYYEPKQKSQRNIKLVDTENINPNRKTKENICRKNLNEKIRLVKETLHGFIKNGKNIKERVHAIFCEIKPILKVVQQSEDKKILKKVEELKIKLRTFEHQFKTFQVQNSGQIVEELHRSLAEHINSIQSEIRTQKDKNQVELHVKIRKQKDELINNLTEQNDMLNKQIQILQRKMEKLERESNKFTTENDNNFNEYQRSIQQKIQIYEEKIHNLEKQLRETKKEEEQGKNRQKRLQKQIKMAQYERSEMERKFREQSQTIRSKKQQYLLNEIVIMKKEFQSDLDQITALYAQKEQDYPKTIEQLNQTISVIKKQNEILKEIEKKMIQQTQPYHSNLSRLKKQNQCLVTDMHRMNEELYQHWLALKDIKTLSTRLQIFPKFSRIYQDLAYNQFLFA